MKNRSPRDNTITGIAENIAELDALPAILTEKQEKIESTIVALNELSAVENDYTDNKIPASNRQISALSAHINMLELPIKINAIKELVKKDEMTITDAKSLRSENEKGAQPYLDERKRIKQAIDLLTSKLSYENSLAITSSNLTAQNAALSRLQNIIADLKQRRDSAYAIKIASKVKFESLKRDLENLRIRHRQIEEPVINSVNQMASRLENLKGTYQLALQNQAASIGSQNDEQNSERNHAEKSKQAYANETRFIASAGAARTRMQALIADLERERSAYEKAKQAAAYSSSTRGNNSSHDKTPPATKAQMVTIPAGLGGFTQVPVTSSSHGGYTSSQNGNNSYSSHSTNETDMANILAGHSKRISELERAIQSADVEAKQCERKAASEHQDALNHEAIAVTAHQQAEKHAEQARFYAQQAALTLTDINHTNAEFMNASENLRQMQQHMRNDDDKLRYERDAADNQHNYDVDQFNVLDNNVINTSNEMNDTSQSITNLTREIENIRKSIDATSEAINTCEYATQHSCETLEKMDKVQADLADPYLNKIDECNRIISHTNTQMQSKESEINNHETKLRAAIATVEQSKQEFAAICGSVDLPDLLQQLVAARSANENLQQQLNTQCERVRLKQSELDNLQAEQDDFISRQNELKHGDLLMRLYENPAEALRLFHADILNTIKNYAETHHSGLIWQTRASLLTLTARANFIYNNNVAGKTENDKQRTRFYQLSGLLRHEAEFVKIDPSYRETLQGLFKHRDVEQNDVLKAFNQLAANSQQQLHDMTEAEVLNHDVVEYNSARKVFDDLLAHGPQHKDRKWCNFYSTGKRISTCIHEQETRIRKPDEPVFDTHLHTRIFQLASVVLQHPDNASARTELHALTQGNKIGQPSTARKVIGAILSFIGSALIVVGGLALAGTIPGISLPVSVPMIAVGSHGVIGGIFTFFSGFQRGLSKAYSDFDHLAAGISNNMQTNSVHDAVNTSKECHEPPTPFAPSF